MDDAYWRCTECGALAPYHRGGCEGKGGQEKVEVHPLGTGAELERLRAAPVAVMISASGHDDQVAVQAAVDIAEVAMLRAMAARLADDALARQCGTGGGDSETMCHVAIAVYRRAVRREEGNG